MEAGSPHRPEAQPAEPAVRYASLADYLRVLRRHRLLIAVVTVLFAGVAVALSASRETVYEATSQVAFRDVLADLNLIGASDSTPELAPAQRSALNAETITRPAITREAARGLQGELTRDALEDSVTARVGPQTNLVIVTAEAATAELAAKVANAIADAAREVQTKDQLQRLRRVVSSLEDEIEEARDEEVPGVSSIRLSVLEQQLSRTQTLLEIAEPVQIVERAEPPSAAVSPKPARDGVLGAIVGLVVGLLAAFTRDSLDRRLRTAKEVHDELGFPVIGRVSDTALGYGGLVVNGRGPMLESDFEQFRVLRMNLAALRGEPPPKTLLVTSSMPEEGKSTVSMSLASAAAIAGQRVLLVECDLRRPSFAKRLAVTREPGLSDYLMDRATPQEILQTVELQAPTSTNGGPTAPGPVATLVSIAAGSAVANPAELLITARFRDFLAKVSSAYDLVVLDGGPLLAVVDPLELVPQVDGVVFCVRVQRTTREHLRAARTALANLPERPVGAVMTGLKRGGQDSYDYYYGY